MVFVINRSTGFCQTQDSHHHTNVQMCSAGYQYIYIITPWSLPTLSSDWLTTAGDIHVRIWRYRRKFQEKGASLRTSQLQARPSLASATSFYAAIRPRATVLIRRFNPDGRDMPTQLLKLGKLRMGDTSFQDGITRNTLLDMGIYPYLAS